MQVVVVADKGTLASQRRLCLERGSPGRSPGRNDGLDGTARTFSFDFAKFGADSQFPSWPTSTSLPFSVGFSSPPPGIGPSPTPDPGGFSDRGAI